MGTFNVGVGDKFDQTATKAGRDVGFWNAYVNPSDNSRQPTQNYHRQIQYECRYEKESRLYFSHHLGGDGLS